MNVGMLIFNILVFPGVLFIVVVALLLAGLDRKVLAHMQKRVGPPIIQPLYDFLKLCGKETIIPAAANRLAFIGAPIVSLIALVFVGLLIPVAGISGFSFHADLIVILYLLTTPAVCLIVGGSASGSPFAGVGISREMVAMIGYELPLVVIFLAVAKKMGMGIWMFSMDEIYLWQQAFGCGAFQWALIPAALAMLLVIPAEVGTQPFDVAEAETEICEGPLIEYSGPPLALFKLSSCVKMFIMSSLFTALFFGGIDTGMVWLNVIIFVAIDILVTLVCMTLIHGITARLKIEHMFKFYWTVVAGLAAVSLILVWIGL